MVQKCCIAGCRSKFNSTTKISFFSFPSEENQKHKWINAIVHINKQACGTISKHSRICEKHFESNEIRKCESRCTLMKRAIPTIFHKKSYNVDFYESIDEDLKDIEFIEPSDPQLLVPSNENLFVLKHESHEPEVHQSIEIIHEITPEMSCNETTTKEVLAPTTPKHYNSPDDRLFVEDIEDDEPTTLKNSDDNVFIEDIGEDEPTTSKNYYSKQKQVKKRRLCYPGDLHDDDELTSKSTKKFIQVLKTTIIKQRKAMSNLLQKNRRSAKKISSLKILLRELMQKVNQN